MLCVNPTVRPLACPTKRHQPPTPNHHNPPNSKQPTNKPKLMRLVSFLIFPAVVRLLVSLCSLCDAAPTPPLRIAKREPPPTRPRTPPPTRPLLQLLHQQHLQHLHYSSHIIVRSLQHPRRRRPRRRTHTFIVRLLFRHSNPYKRNPPAAR